GGVLQPDPHSAAGRVGGHRTPAARFVVAHLPAHPAVWAAGHLRRPAPVGNRTHLPVVTDLPAHRAVVGDTAARLRRLVRSHPLPADHSNHDRVACSPISCRSMSSKTPTTTCGRGVYQQGWKVTTESGRPPMKGEGTTPDYGANSPMAEAARS